MSFSVALVLLSKLMADALMTVCSGVDERRPARDVDGERTINLFEKIRIQIAGRRSTDERQLASGQDGVIRF